MSTGLSALVGAVLGLAGIQVERHCAHTLSAPSLTPAGQALLLLVLVFLGGFLSIRGVSMPILIKELVLVDGLLVLSSIDSKTFTLPDVLTLPLIGLGVAFSAVFGQPPLREALLGVVLGFGLLWCIDFVYHRLTGRLGMGRGDFKLLSGAGAFMGAFALPEIMLGASVCGLLFALQGLVQGRLHRHSEIPFGPCIALSAIGVSLMSLW